MTIHTSVYDIENHMLIEDNYYEEAMWSEYTLLPKEFYNDDDYDIKDLREEYILNTYVESFEEIAYRQAVAQEKQDRLHWQIVDLFRTPLIRY